jgi:hypothetical protein
MDQAAQHVAAVVGAALGRHYPVDICLFGNGLLLDKTLRSLATMSSDETQCAHDTPDTPEASQGIRVFRGLAIAGFHATWDATALNLQVQHTSGNVFYCGLISPNCAPNCDKAHRPSHPLLCGPVFQVLPHRDIRGLEIRKFFVNAVLGWVIGPNMLPNGSLKERLTPQMSMQLANVFAKIFVDGGDPLEFSSLLWQTASETFSNINSVSRAWSDGDPTLAYYFRDTIQTALGSLPAGDQSAARNVLRNCFELG